MLRRALRITFAGSALAAIAACGGSSSTGPTAVFTTVALTPPSPSVPVGASITMVATPKDQHGASMTGLPPATFSSSDASKVSVNPSSGVVTAVAPGSATITATIVSGSVTHASSQLVSVTQPSSTGNVTATTTLAFVPPTLTVTAGSGTATVTWTFQSVTHTVTFDSEPSGATGPSDIPASTSTSVSRDFTTHGDYHYHCSIHPSMMGTITVQ